MLGERRADERERSSERVDQLLEVAAILPDPFAPPVPPGRQLPRREVLRQSVADTMQ
jgi:hypothetical protein